MRQPPRSMSMCAADSASDGGCRWMSVYVLGALHSVCAAIPVEVLQLILETAYYLGSPISCPCPGCSGLIDRDALQLCPNREFMNNRFMQTRAIWCPDCVPDGRMPTPRTFKPISGGHIHVDTRMNEGARYRQCLGSMHKRCTTCHVRICCACSCGGFCVVCIPLHSNLCDRVRLFACTNQDCEGNAIADVLKDVLAKFIISSRRARGRRVRLGYSRILLFCYENITEMLFVTCGNCDDGQYYNPYAPEVDRRPLALTPPLACSWPSRPGEIRMAERVCVFCAYQVPQSGLHLRHLRCVMCNGYACCSCTYLFGGERPLCPFCANLEIDYPTGPFDVEFSEMTRKMRTAVYAKNERIMNYYADMPIWTCACDKVWVFHKRARPWTWGWRSYLGDYVELDGRDDILWTGVGQPTVMGAFWMRMGIFDNDPLGCI